MVFIKRIKFEDKLCILNLRIFDYNLNFAENTEIFC